MNEGYKYMKNKLFIIIIISFFFICCDTEPNGNNEFSGNIRNANVYLLGTNAYWKNEIRYSLNIPTGYDEITPEKIIVSNGIVFVIGTFYVDAENGGRYTQACYWENGVFNAFSTNNDIIVNPDNVFVSNGIIYASSFKGYWWIGKNQNKIPSEKSSVYDLFVYNNTVYMSGYNYDNNWTACYWLNNNQFNLPIQGNYYSPRATGIFVDGGNVYSCGDRGESGKIFYWINGTMFNINTPSVNRYETNTIFVSSGKIFIFGSFSHATEGGIVTPCYWEDGILKLLPTGTNMAVKPLVYNGKVYTYDNEWLGRANYFINGESFPIDQSLDYTMANSIFIFNDDVFITGGYYNNDFQYKSCYWINGTNRIDLNFSIIDIFIEQK